MNRVLIGAAALAFIVLAGCDSKEETDLANAAAKTVVEHTTLKNGWAKIEVVQSEPRSYQLAIIYSVPPRSEAQIASDTTSVVRALISELIKRGKSPAEEATVIMCGGASLIAGETKPRLRWYGWSTYLGAADRIEFEPK